MAATFRDQPSRSAGLTSQHNHRPIFNYNLGDTVLEDNRK